MIGKTINKLKEFFFKLNSTRKNITLELLRHLVGGSIVQPLLCPTLNFPKHWSKSSDQHSQLHFAISKF